MFDPSQDQASKLLINEVVRIIRYDIGKCEEELELLNLNTVLETTKTLPVSRVLHLLKT